MNLLKGKENLFCFQLLNNRNILALIPLKNYMEEKSLVQFLEVGLTLLLIIKKIMNYRV